MSSTTLADGWLSDFLDVPRADLVPSVRRDASSAPASPSAATAATTAATTRDHARADGGVPAAEPSSAPATSRRRRRAPCSSTCPGEPPSRPGSRSSPGSASPAAAATGTTARISPVTRGQMAVFLLKTLATAASYVPPPAAGIFEDVPRRPLRDRWVEHLYAEGVTGGCLAVPLRYCPVQRQHPRARWPCSWSRPSASSALVAAGTDCSRPARRLTGPSASAI